jgi:hypothetical protein
MKFTRTLCLLILLPWGRISAQPFTSSNLPIVIINTDGGVAVPDYPRIRGTMKIIDRGPGQRNYLTDQNTPEYLDYNGRIDIELRGSSSQATEKKQYGFSTLKADNVTVDNVHLLGFPEEHDWILNGMVFDPALMRDYLSYNLSRQVGEYATRTAYCELVLNGSYTGLYLLQEKIKSDDNRVNITDIETTDTDFPKVTGGYITKADKNTGGDPAAFSIKAKQGYDVWYIHHQPKPEAVTPSQNDYIRTQFQALETTAKNGNASLANGYPSVIDIPSFIDYMLISELASNADAYMYSTFFHKDRNGKLRAGPVWDCDLTYGNDLFMWGFDRSKTNIWQFSNGDNEGSRFWWDLFDNATYRCYLSRRWHELTAPGQPLNPESLSDFIDSTAAKINEAVEREHYRWGYTGTFTQRIQEIKSFMQTRISWMTTNLGSYAGCSDISLPPLVINKIMYHPETSEAFPEEQEGEFIELLNNGGQAVNLTGIYFMGTGFVFQFPAGTAVDAGGSIVLASNAAEFRARHGRDPNAEFTRHLSNKSQTLILADGFGNIIDSLTYRDTISWPEADGNGYYLQLTDPGLDNSLAENWTASNEVFVSDNPHAMEPLLEVYPNPVQDVLRIRTTTVIRSVSLSDLQGRLLETHSLGSTGGTLDLSRYSSGIYMLKIETEDRTFIRKIVKE